MTPLDDIKKRIAAATPPNLEFMVRDCHEDYDKVQSRLDRAFEEISIDRARLVAALSERLKRISY